MKAGVVAAALALAGCGGGAAPSGVRPDRCDFQALGACVAVEGGLAVDPAHVERQLRMALDYWGATDDALADWAIVFVEGAPNCNGAPSSGCTWYGAADRTVRVHALDDACPETAQLVHELGHVLHGDGAHQGPWWSWTAEQDATYDVVRRPGASAGCGATRYYTARP